MKITPFNFYCPIAKSYESDDGQAWIWEAPVSNPDADLEGDRFTRDQMAKGLDVLFRLGAQVDYDHQYPKTHDPKWIVGKALDRHDAKHPNSAHVVPWVRGELSKQKEIARSVKEHLDAGMPMGISVYGAMAKGADGEPYPIYTMLSMTPTPVVAENTGTVRLVKALSALPRGADLEKVTLPGVPGLWVPDTLEALDPWGLLREEIRKAMACSGGIPPSGPGADAALVGELTDTDSGEAPRKRKRKRGRGDEAGEAVRKGVRAMILAAEIGELRRIYEHA